MKSNLALALLFGLASSVACDSDKKAPTCTVTCPNGMDSGACESPGTCAGDDAGSLDGGEQSDGGDASTRPGDAGSDGGHDAGIEPADCSLTPNLGNLNVETVVGGLERLVYAAQPRGTNDWYLVEQTGLIRVLKSGASTTSVFLDLTSETAGVAANDRDERGILSLAFPPDYAASGLFYVMLTPSTPDGNARTDLFQHDLVLRYSRSSDPFVADPDSRQVVVDVPRSANNHNGGTLAFSPEGMLYVGTGDGGGACNSDKPGAPQDVGSLNGKILKLDFSQPAPYGATDNPFGMSGDQRVLLYGLRNPFRFGVDSATGDLFVADVGQDQFEEIDYVPNGAKGFNFGWAEFEGNSKACAGKQIRAGSSVTPPTFVVQRKCSAAFCDYLSIVGGTVYRGKALPQLYGVYLFGDFVGAQLGGFYQCPNSHSPVATLRKRCNGTAEACLPAAAGISELLAIVEGADHEIYLVVNQHGSKLLKLTAK